MKIDAKDHLIKTRDDSAPLRFNSDAASPETPAFQLAPESKCSWLKDGESFGIDKLRSRIEPWLTALFQSEHLSVLVGSGLTHAVHSLATGKSLPGMEAQGIAAYADELKKEVQRAATASGRAGGNIEDQIRAANELLRGLEILALTRGEKSAEGKGAVALRLALDQELGRFADSILLGERGLLESEPSAREKAFNYLVSFLMSFASRSGTRDRLNLFTTNYDRYIEAGADVAGLRLIDRFVGSLAPVFRASRMDVDMHYNPPGIRGEPRYLEGVTRFTKLHGSVDWVDLDNSIRRFGLPFGVEKVDPYLKAADSSGVDATRLMVYPNAAKDRETAAYPYVELFRDFAAAVCRPNSTLVCFGYGFGDEHINRVVQDMLTIPSTHVVIISFGDPLGRIGATYEHLGRDAQITMLVGPHLGDLSTLVDNYLPKPAIDRATFRLGELLKARWGVAKKETGTATPPSPNSEFVGLEDL